MPIYSSSWKQRKLEKKNKKKALLLLISSFILVVFFLAFGLPVLVRLTSFLYELRSSNQAIEKQDKTPPPPPSIHSIPKTTNKAFIDIKGNSEPSGSVWLYSGLTEKEFLVGLDGSFTATIDLFEGENTFYFISKDLSGNESKKTQDFTVLFDKTAPEINLVKPENGQKFYGDNQRQVVVEGFTESGAIVHINLSRAVVFGEGKFSQTVFLNEGENNLIITSEDSAGNKTEVNLSVYYYP